MNYQKIYDQLYKLGYHEDLNYSHAKDLCKWLRENLEFKSILDIGCSSGWVLYHFKDKSAFGIDVSIEAVRICRARGLRAKRQEAHKLEAMRADVVISTDCFEHIMPEHVDQAISRAYYAAGKYIAMKISPRLDTAKWKQLVGTPLHLTIEPIEWWRDKFLKHGGKVIHESGDDTFVIEKGIK